MRLPWPARLGLLFGLGLTLWLLVPLLLPPILRLVCWLLTVLAEVLFWFIVFWLISGLLPKPWGSLLRRTFLGVFRLLGRLFGNLIGC